MAPVQGELAPNSNRPNSTLERAAPFIRSLQEEQADRDKKKAGEAEKEGVKANETASSTNQTVA